MTVQDERDPAWVAHLAARESQRMAARRRREIEATTRAWLAAEAHLAHLKERATIPDLTALRDARIGDWRADLDRQITRDDTGAWTTAPLRRETRQTA